MKYLKKYDFGSLYCPAHRAAYYAKTQTYRRRKGVAQCKMKSHEIHHIDCRWGNGTKLVWLRYGIEEAGCS